MKIKMLFVLLFMSILSVNASAGNKLSLGFKWSAYRPYDYFYEEYYKDDISIYLESKVTKFWGLSLDYSYWNRETYTEYVDLVHKFNLELSGLSLGAYYKAKMAHSDYIFPYSILGMTYFRAKYTDRCLIFENSNFQEEVIDKDIEKRYAPFIAFGFDYRCTRNFYLNFEASYFWLKIDNWNDFNFSNWKFGIGIRYRFVK